MDCNQIEAARAAIPFVQTQLNKQRWFQDLEQGIAIQLPNKLKLLVRWMNYRDIPTVYAIECQVFPSPWSVENFMYDLDNRNANISFVGVIDDQVVAYAISYIVHDEFHISNLAVTPDFRRMKIGETMLRIALQIGVTRDCQFAFLEVRKSNEAALALYEKHGFQIVGSRKNYYQNEHEDALLMTKKLAGEKIYGMV